MSVENRIQENDRSRSAVAGDPPGVGVGEDDERPGDRADDWNRRATDPVFPGDDRERAQPGPTGRRHVGEVRVRDIPTGRDLSPGDRVERPIRGPSGRPADRYSVAADGSPDDDGRPEASPLSVLDHVRDLRFEAGRRGLVRGVPAWLCGRAIRDPGAETARRSDVRVTGGPGSGGVRRHEPGRRDVLLGFYLRLLLLVVVVGTVLVPLFPAVVLLVSGDSITWVVVTGLSFVWWLARSETTRP